MFIGAMMVANPSQAGGGGGIGLEIHIKDGLETQAVYVGLAILIAVYVLIIFETVHRTLAAAVGGVVAMLALNYYDTGATLTLAEVTTMIDWETIGLLRGMMGMVGILSNTGVFEYFAVLSYKKSGGSIWTLVVILCSVTAVLSAFLDNVTTMLLLTPVTIQLAKVLDIKPIPLLISEVLFSNIGGAATMIGDPPNIMIGSGLSPAKIASAEDGKYAYMSDYGVTFNDFIIEMGPGILMCIVPSFMLLKWYYADEFSGSRIRDVAELEAKYGIKDPKMLKVAGFILVLVILNFFLHPITHIAVSWIALVGAVIMLLATDRHELEEPLHHVEWTTLLFFAGLFVLVHSLQYMGVIAFIGEYVERAIAFFGSDTGDGQTVRLAAAILIVLWVSAVASAFIDNIPLGERHRLRISRQHPVHGHNDSHRSSDRRQPRRLPPGSVDLGACFWCLPWWKRYAHRCISERRDRRDVGRSRLPHIVQRVFQSRVSHHDSHDLHRLAVHAAGVHCWW